MVDSSLVPPSHIMLTGTCILVQGILQQPSLQGKNIIELKAEKILHVGIVNHATYPLSKKRIPLDSLRDHAHFRPRTTTVNVINLLYLCSCIILIAQFLNVFELFLILVTLCLLQKLEIMLTFSLFEYPYKGGICDENP